MPILYEFEFGHRGDSDSASDARTRMKSRLQIVFAFDARGEILINGG